MQDINKAAILAHRVDTLMDSGVSTDVVNAEAAEWAEVYSTPLQALVDEYRSLTTGVMRRAALRKTIQRAARIGLKPGEVRTLKVGNMTTSVFSVSNGSFTRVDTRREDVRPGGELLLSQSGVQMRESDALRLFATVVTLIAGV